MAGDANGRMLDALKGWLPVLAIVFAAGAGWFRLAALEGEVLSLRQDVKRVSEAVIRLEARAR